MGSFRGIFGLGAGVFSPLGARRRAVPFRAPWSEALPALRACGCRRFHRIDFLWLRNSRARPLDAALSFVSTISDLLIWDRSLRNTTLLSQESIDRMVTQVRLVTGEVRPYGFGWHVLLDDCGTVLYHAGGLWSFRSLYLSNMRPGLSVVMLANCREANVAALTSGVLAILAPDIGAAWAKATSVQRALAAAGATTPWSVY